MDVKKIVFGGWYQRTTLHLSEIHKFLDTGIANKNLSEAKLKSLRKGLDLKSVKRCAGYLEYLYMTTNSGIEIYYYEDGLYLLTKEGSEYSKIKKELKDYFEDNFVLTINYLFSLGAPTPKILSNMKEIHPFVIEDFVRDSSKYLVEDSLGKPYLKTNSNGISVIKTPDNILVLGNNSRKGDVRLITEMQIFFREFKSQLHRYLEIHRNIWEEISEIKERKFVRGDKISEYRAKLDSYQKTISLIKNRINQMSSYAHTRASISKNRGIDKRLDELFLYRFEDLFNTLSYIKEIWSMTEDYVHSAIKVMVELEAKSSNKGIKSIQFFVSFGVLMGILRYFEPGYIPSISLKSVPFVLAVVGLATILDYIFKYFGNKKEYKITFVERDKTI